MSKLSAGGSAASREAELMVGEKIRAGLDLAVSSLGMTPLAGTQKAIRHYRGKVAANRRRLSR